MSFRLKVEFFVNLKHRNKLLTEEAFLKIIKYEFF